MPYFKTKISKIWNVHFQNRISDFILKNFPMFIPEIPIFNLKIRVWHFLTIFGPNRISKTNNLTGKKTTEMETQNHADLVRNLKEITENNQNAASSTLRTSGAAFSALPRGFG